MARREEEKVASQKIGQKRAKPACGVAGDGALDPVKMLLTWRHKKGTSSILTDLETRNEEDESKWPESSRRLIFGMLNMDQILRMTSQFASQMWKTSLKAPWSSRSQDGTEMKLEEERSNI